MPEELYHSSLSGALVSAEASLGISAPLELPTALQRLLQVFENYAWGDLGYSLLVVLLVVVLGRVLSATCLRLFARWAERTDSVIDDAIARHLTRPLHWLAPGLLLVALSGVLVLPAGMEAAVKHGIVIWVIVGFGWFAIGLTRVAQDTVMHRYDMSAEDNLQARTVYTQMKAFRNLARFVIALLTFAAVLTTFEGVRSLGTGLIASTGVAGVVLGFAAQRSIALVLAGVHIAISQPIRVDDVVIVEGQWGVIEEINLTYVVVRIWDLRRLIVPVNYFTEKPFQNWTRVSADLLGTVELQLDYSVDLAQLRAELRRIAEASPNWDKKVCALQVTDASDHSMLVRPLVSAKNASCLWDLRCEVREKLIAYVQQNFPRALPKLRAEAALGGSMQRAFGDLGHR